MTAAAPFVLLHGWACPTATWRPVAERLTAAGHHVVVPELLGYGPGPSRLQERAWTLEAAAHDVARVLERAGSPAVVAGHSLGGSVAATVAALRPELVTAVAFVGMVPVPPGAATAERLSRMFLGSEGPPSREAIEACLAAWYGTVPEDPGLAAELKTAFGVPGPVLRGSLRAALGGVQPGVTETLTGPVAVVLGANDRTRPPEDVERLLAAHPDWSLTTVPDAGHMVQWEAPDACASALASLAEGL
ncbi:alpha/beta fold hydrolase [Sinomonas sp. ASV486]|uniref:alpha/beta fold hydrolase n=1 Tax=Sinomonas sp. ASV486 TaxID=3051170 RepID=UPI0027DE0F32|nr:alpha/beta fold hydrolase [Sinomonas sp. ASV486]MDQ4489121.1 alpha/beta fold hydrolase [Sinomonas sp. ASV486]